MSMVHRWKKPLCLGMCLVMVMGTLGGCSSKEKNLTTIRLNEVAHSIFYAPQYVAIENGYFEEEGIALELVNGMGADNVMTAVVSGEADIGFMGSESSIYVYQEGADDTIVNFAQLTNRAGNFLVAKEADEDFTWSDLKGKTVLGGREGGMPEMVFEYVLKKNGLDPEKDLDIVKNIDFGLTAQAYASGQGDYTVEFEPYASSLEADNKGVVVASLGEASGDVPYTAYSVKKSYMKEHEKELLAFTKAVQKGLDYVQNHTPEEIAKVIAPQFSETEEDTLVTIITRYYNQGTWKDNLIFEKDSFELLQDILQEAGVLNERVPYEDLVDNTWSEKVVK
jgi:NitT/TauT family transport system substrate-binding protein